jgi:hypothetical protein
MDMEITKDSIRVEIEKEVERRVYEVCLEVYSDLFARGHLKNSTADFLSQRVAREARQAVTRHYDFDLGEVIDNA